LAWVVVAAGAVVTPALVHGTSLGPYDLLSVYGLTAQHGVVVHNSVSLDQIDQMLPWSNLAWTQVHQGHLPLWNPYAALGGPLAFNWQSSAFSVPALIGYLAPLRLAYTVQVLATLVIAGVGCFVLGRVLRLGVIGCAMAATVFELSGPFMGWLGWPVASVMSWSGWLFAATVLVVRGAHRLRDTVLVAVALAGAVYAGQPDQLILLLGAWLAFSATLVAFGFGRHHRGMDRWRPPADLALASVAGFALSAPLWLPGLQLLGGSVRSSSNRATSLPPSDLTHLVFQGFDGLPVAGGHWFGPLNGYVESAAYVGVIALVLTGVALVLRRRQPEVVAFSVVALGAILVGFAQPVDAVLASLPHGSTIHWNRSLLVLAFALAMLSGIGLDRVVRTPAERRTRLALGWSLGAVGLAVAAVWVFGRGHLDGVDAAVRTRSFVWPLVALGVTAAVTIALARFAGRRPETERRWAMNAGRWGAGLLLAAETVFLVVSGAPLPSSSSVSWTPTPAVRSLQRTVGTGLVALGEPACAIPPTLGIPPNVNVAFAVQQLSVYDPMIPKAYFNSWTQASGQPSGFAGYPEFSTFCPGLNSAALARVYGASFVLEPAGSPGPKGATFVRRVGTEELFRVGGSALATLAPLLPTGALPFPSAPARPVSVTHPDPASWKLSVTANRTSVLRLHLTDVPGWRATIDGRPLTLRPFDSVMLEAIVPPGHHLVVVSYWPVTFTLGMVLAGLCLLVLVTLVVVDRVRPRRRSTGHHPRDVRRAVGPG
jgi:hypothetical protein